MRMVWLVLVSSTAWAADVDGDGYDAVRDCDDNDATVYPGAPEVPGDGIDQNCDSFEVCWLDGDADGHGGRQWVQSRDLTCTSPGLAPLASDCDDADPTIYPGAPEIVGDAIDQNCDGLLSCYVDRDGDGYGTNLVVSTPGPTCAAPGLARTNDDCADFDADIHPGAPELPGDGVDQNCDGRDGRVVVTASSPQCLVTREGEITWRGATPGGQVFVVGGDGRATTVPYGVCRGAPLPFTPLGGQIGTSDARGAGGVRITGMSAAACGAQIVVMDATTCSVSAVTSWQ